MREQLDAAIDRKVGNWLGWQMFYVILYPIALLQIPLFWIRFARHEYLRGQNFGILMIHFLALAFLSLIGIIVAAFTDVWGFTVIDFVILGLPCLVLGLVFAGFYGSINNRKLALLERYHALAMDENYTHVGEIAAQMGRSVTAAALALNFMNEYGVLPYYVDEATGELIHDEEYEELAEEDEDEEEEEEEDEEWDEEETEGEAEVEVEYEDDEEDVDVVDDGPLTIECAGCGSKAQIYRGQAATCEYCATPLSWPARVS
ncbi:hypothetical protein [Cohnella nanjingensis]|uniref:Uncharacterized protein n=1 Tax=Cohnella nanjingensis TaxID=1387779 RepID=A0A7X0RR95_9BACL|nr:hypothetical protein [Cohnella nanjingensis]MBB6672028.1 hypothetical protein [Cohnella nanjingensis]